IRGSSIAAATLSRLDPRMIAAAGGSDASFSRIRRAASVVTEVFGSERAGEELVERKGPPDIPGLAADMDGSIGFGELPKLLAAAAAWRHQPFAGTRDGRFDDPPPPGKHHRRNRARLGAGALRIGGVLHIVARMDAPRLVLDFGTHQELRIGRISSGPRLYSSCDEDGVRPYFLFTLV